MKRTLISATTAAGLAAAGMMLAPAAQALTNPAKHPYPITVTIDGVDYTDGGDTLPGFDDEACGPIPGASVDFANSRMIYRTDNGTKTIPWTEWERTTGYDAWLAKQQTSNNSTPSTSNTQAPTTTSTSGSTKTTSKPSKTSTKTSATTSGSGKASNQTDASVTGKQTATTTGDAPQTTSTTTSTTPTTTTGTAPVTTTEAPVADTTTTDVENTDEIELAAGTPIKQAAIVSDVEDNTTPVLIGIVAGLAVVAFALFGGNAIRGRRGTSAGSAR